ncbi:MAG: response regulator, partial [Pseudomonadota bacterium]
LFRVFLEKVGYRVTTLNNPIAALELFKRNPNGFDLLFTDLNMPRVTGITLLQACREIKPNLPVIICTGYGEDLDGQGAAERYHAAYLHKPFDFYEVAKKIRAALDHRD